MPWAGADESSGDSKEPRSASAEPEFSQQRPQPRQRGLLPGPTPHQRPACLCPGNAGSAHHLAPEREPVLPQRGRPALRARAGPARPHGVHRPDRHRRDDPRDRGAVDRPRRRRVRAVPVAVLGVPAGPGGVGVGLREARGHRRAKADHAARDRSVPRRERAVRGGVEHAGPDRLPRRAGPRCRCGAPIAITIAGDIYTVAERATAQGYIASVWAMSSVVGPTLGGVFAELGLWRWIFFVNVPLCLLAAGADHAELPRDRGTPRAPRRLPRAPSC